MKKAIAFLLVILVGAFLMWRWLGNSSRLYLSPPEILGGVVRTGDAGGGRLHYLTGQWERKIYWLGGGRSSIRKYTENWLNVDLWELDATTAQPLSRRRLKRDKVNGDLKALGMEQGVLWARIPELVGIRLKDGAIVADRAKIEARNPGLAGLIPKTPQAGTFLPESMLPLKFDPHAGMLVRLDDARFVRIDPLTVEATPHVAPEPGTAAGETGTASRSPMISLSNGMNWGALVRGLAMTGPDGNGEWLGLLSDSDLVQLKERHTANPQMDFSVPQRQRLYRAKLRTVKEFMGPRMKYLDPAVLPESPEFLTAGLLTKDSGGSSGQSALWRRDPDSVFVLSRDRLGEDGRLQLARISGPNGTPAWSTALPLYQMRAWVPGERHVQMLGPDPSAARSPMAQEDENPVMQVITIDLETGALNSFNPDLHRDWPVVDASGKSP